MEICLSVALEEEEAPISTLAKKVRKRRKMICFELWCQKHLAFSHRPNNNELHQRRRRQHKRLGNPWRTFLTVEGTEMIIHAFDINGLVDYLKCFVALL